jgi:hypothetical protein
LVSADLRTGAPASPLSVVVAGTALLLACSVYDVPRASSDGSNGGSAGKGGTSTGGQTNGGSAGKGGAPSPSGGSGHSTGSGGSSGSSGSSAGGSAGNEAGSGGDGGEAPTTDECPDDPDKLAPGTCGCGVPDDDPDTHADCESLKASLLHRYDFEATGTEVTDRVGSSHGALVNGAEFSEVDGAGVVLLGGGSDGGYVNLPNGLVSSLTDVTIESWITWGGGDDWQRIFDFGDTTAATPEDTPANGKSYLFASPKSENDFLRAGYSLNGNAEEVAIDALALPLSSLTQVVLVADSTADKLVLYVDGQSVGEQNWNGELANINDVNAWLGRSQYEWDPGLSGVFHEFRIYGNALNAAQVESAFVAGTDPSFLAY